MFEYDQQSFTLLRTNYNNETYYLQDNGVNGLILVDETQKNKTEQEQHIHPTKWRKFLFSIIGPV